jgi:hypothetical protein
MLFQRLSTTVAWISKFIGNLHVLTHMNKNYFSQVSYFYHRTHIPAPCYNTQNLSAKLMHVYRPLNLIQVLYGMNFNFLEIVDCSIKYFFNIRFLYAITVHS